MSIFTAINIASFLMACAGYILSISLALFLAQVKESGPLIVGLAGFAGNLAYTVVTFLLAWRSIRKRNPVFIYATAGIGVLYMLMFFSPIPVIFLLLLITGALYAFFWPSMQESFSGSVDELKIGIFNLFWSAGVICGAFSAGFLYVISPLVPSLIILLLALPAFFLLISRKKELLLMKIYAEVDVNREVPMPGIIKEVRLLNFLHFFAVSTVLYLYPKLGLERHFSPQFIGSIAGILLISRFITFSLLIDKTILLHRAIFGVSCTLFFIGCSLAGLATNQYAIIAGVVILGVAGAFSYHNSLLMHIKYNLKAEIHESLIGAGLFTGALTAGFLGQVFNLPVAFVTIGGGIFLAGLWHSRMFLSGRQRDGGL